MNKFSKQDSVHKDNGVQPTNGTEVTPSKRFKRPPTIKPKPCRSSLQLQTGAEQAPPLPVKRSRKPKDTEQGEEADSISVEGGRSGTAEITQALLKDESHCTLADMLTFSSSLWQDAEFDVRTGSREAQKLYLTL